MNRINVTVWDEAEGAIGPYPQGIHNAIADFLRASGQFNEVRIALQPQSEHGLTEDVLNSTDVLVYWAHCFHHQVEDAIVERIARRVLDGMGLILLHSAHASKIFRRLTGTDTDRLRWREVGERERVWRIEPGHPITHGVPEYFDIPNSEMYGEQFGIPAPDELLFISWYEGGEVFRSGCTFKRGLGKIFFFAPGHETFPIYYMPEMQKIITNAVAWAAPAHIPAITGGKMDFIRPEASV
ncbi:MAG: ThuA domain-containing protein [Defluviitaleaceae bacterium]|nr:ThuA domain-containing protein [Defluviitaleaceae bacterium]MCL2274558.1 ThuA domain-containing protein [Defluviitaleaceae bacterium]